MTTLPRVAMWQMGIRFPKADVPVHRFRLRSALAGLAILAGAAISDRALADQHDLFKRYTEENGSAFTSEQKATLRQKFVDELTGEFAFRQSAKQVVAYLTDAGASCVYPNNEFIHCVQSSIQTHNDHVYEMYQAVTTWGVAVKFSGGKILSIDVNVKLTVLPDPSFSPARPAASSSPSP